MLRPVGKESEQLLEASFAMGLVGCQINAPQIEYILRAPNLNEYGSQALEPNVTGRGEVEMLWPRWAEGPLRDTR